MDSFDFELYTWDQFTRRLEAELKVTYPVLRRRVDFMSLPKTDPLTHGESPIACLIRVVKAMQIAGVGSRQGLTLSYEDLTITTFMSYLPPSMQQDIYREFKRWNISLAEMVEFARIMTTSDSLKIGRSKVAAITGSKPRSPPKKTPVKKCSKCGKMGHLERECKSGVTCFYCHGQRHHTENCWINPASKVYRPGWSPSRNSSNSSVNQITDNPPGGVVAAIGSE